LLGSLSGGQAVNMVWCALLNGATLCPYPMQTKGTVGLRSWMIEQRITVYVSSASIFRHFTGALADDETFPLVHAVRLSSEAATSSDFAEFRRHFSERCQFVHTLSSSETANIAVYRCSPSDRVPEGRLPIGALSDGVDLLILDENGRPAPPGEVGEIVIRSRCLAAGYWRQPELTAERFSGAPGETREFRTGDLGRINRQGLLEHAGRADSRVKIRGNRIELTEMEGALQRLPGVQRAAVESVNRADGEPALVGYVVAASGHGWSAQKLRSALRELLPDYMVPSAFVVLDRFPLTSSGKIDREKLRQQAASIERPRSIAPDAPDQPLTTIQQVLLPLWRDVLKRQDIGCDDDFFLCGGDSLSAVDLLRRIEQELQYRLPLAVLMEAPTVRQLEGRLETATLGPTSNTLRINNAGAKRPLFAVSGRYGHALRFLPILRALGPDQPCYGLQPPGMDWTSVGCSTIPEMAAHYIAEIKAVQPQGPYRLLGASFGGLIVFEIARQLQRTKEAIDFLAMIDTSPPTCLVGDKIDVSRSRLFDDGPPPSRSDSIEAINRRVADTHMNARRDYVLDSGAHGTKFDGELFYFFCTGNVVLAHDRRHLWHLFTTEPVRLMLLPGLHGIGHQEPQAGVLSGLLRACLDGQPLPERDPATVFDRTFRIERGILRERIVGSAGEVYRTSRAHIQGRIDWIRADDHSIHVGGWAIEPALKVPAQTIAVFEGGRYLGYGATGVPRPDVAKHLNASSAQYAGFEFYFARDMVMDTSRLRLFALSSDGQATDLGLASAEATGPASRLRPLLAGMRGSFEAWLNSARYWRHR
jgi:acyl carrier protein